MHESDDRPPQPHPPLLAELQAIRELLNDPDGAAVPLLRDVVTPGSVPLVDLNDIFHELATAATRPGTLPHNPGSGRTDPLTGNVAADDVIEEADAAWQRELLIQEVVDEFVPHIEAALRDRLRRLDKTVLRQWLQH